MQVKSGRSGQTVVNGTAMVLAIANNIFSLRRSMREGAGDFWRFGRGVELVGNRRQALRVVAVNLAV